METESKVVADYIAFVQEQIALYQEFSTLSRLDHITPEAINSALANYQTIHTGLIGEYNRAKTNEYELNKKFSRWWDEKFYDVKKELNRNVNSKIKISVTEYENELKFKYADEYWALKDELHVAETKTSFLRRLVESWKKFDNILVNLSLNMRSELRALSLENRINADTDKIRTFEKTEKRRPAS